MPLFLGLDASTQSLTAAVIEIAGDRRRLILESSLRFDEALPAYGTQNGVLPASDPSVATSSPLMWAEALDRMMALVAENVDVRQIVALSGSAQQHGSVYWNSRARRGLESLDPARPLADQLGPSLSRPTSPIWMDSSTSAECAEITATLGGDATLAARTGSRAFARFTGPQIRRFSKQQPAAYVATARIDLVSSFHASLLIGGQAPVDRADASGMNLMDLTTNQWWPDALRATAPDLKAKLPPIVPSSSIAGKLAPYWQIRYGFPAVDVVTWSGDNPCSLIGLGLIHEGQLAISLGTSDTVFAPMNVPRVDPGGTGHVFGAPTGAFMGLTCFQNGSLARERIRDEHGMSWDGFSQALERTPPGNQGGLMLPWFDPEITPRVHAGVRRHDLPPGDAVRNVRAVVEGQAMSMAIHSRWMGVEAETIHATGGGSRNGQVLQVIADVFGAEVYRQDVGNSAALGAALRAAHAGMNAAGASRQWQDVITGFCDRTVASCLHPRPLAHAAYRELTRRYAAFETLALTR